MTNKYLFPRLDWYGNRPVWSEYVMPFSGAGIISAKQLQLLASLIGNESRLGITEVGVLVDRRFRRS